MTHILGNFRGRGSKTDIALGLKLFLRTKGYECGNIDVRSPEEHEQTYGEVIGQYPDGWHQETECVGRYFAVWSNHSPTEVMMADGRLLKAKDGDVILIDNLNAMHRPPNVPRWFARMWNVKAIEKGEYAVSYSRLEAGS